MFQQNLCSILLIIDHRHQRRPRLRILHAIDGAILAAWSPEEIAQAALRHVRQLVDCLGAGVVMFDFGAQEATLFAMDANSEVGLETGTRFPLEEMLGAVDIEVLRQGKVLVEEDILALPATSSGQSSQPPPAIQTLQAAGVRSYVAMPLIAHGELIGALAMGTESPTALAPEQIDITREVTDEIAVALHQARLHAALEAEEQRLEALVEHLPEGILLLDGERRILLSNPAAQTYLLVLTDGENGDALTHLADRPVEELLASPPKGLWHELEVAGPPCQVFEVAARPVEAGLKASRWVMVIRDVTEERDVQQRIQRQEQLAAVGQLAGGIAHDFNNLLTTIMLYAQMLQGERYLPSALAEGLEIILNETRQAADLVGQILDFSRSSPIETHPVDLKPFIKETIHVLERTIPENIRLLPQVEPGKYVVNVDPTRIQQVLMNLVINARDAMPKGGELRIGLSRVEVSPEGKPPVAEIPPLSSPPHPSTPLRTGAGGIEEGKWVCLAVSDTGNGIPPEVLPHIFEPFFTTKPQGKGIGLGLAQVYSIVTQHEEYIGVETETEGGTTFRIYLPDYGEREEETSAEKASTAPRGSGETILLVEDNRRIQAMTRRTLESLGYHVLTATDGQEALEIGRSAEKMDLVLTDVVMPEMGGKELIQELWKETPYLGAVVITGYALAEDLGELKKDGILDILRKPFDMYALAEIVRRALDAD